jgi:hypothetical protein
MGTKINVGVLVLVILASYTYITMNDVRLKVNSASTTFYINENGTWTAKAYEYANLYNGTKLVKKINTDIITDVNNTAKTVTIRRIIQYNNTQGTSLIDTYFFNGNINNVELFPIYHTIEVMNGTGLILKYDVKKLAYFGPTVNVISPQSFGKMKITWQDGYYYSKLSSAGTLTVKYKVNSSYNVYNVRVFDPLVNTTLAQALEDSYVYSIYCQYLKFNISSSLYRPTGAKLFYYGQSESGGIEEPNLTISRITNSWNESLDATQLNTLVTTGSWIVNGYPRVTSTWNNITITSAVQSCWDANQKENCSIKLTPGSCTCGASKGSIEAIRFGDADCGISEFFSSADRTDATYYWRVELEYSTLSENDTVTYLYLNGVQSNRYYELGTVANIKANVTNSTGQVMTNAPICLDINQTGLTKVNTTCANGTVEYNYTTAGWKETFSDNTTEKLLEYNTTSAEQNLTVNLTMNKYDLINNVTLNLTGIVISKNKDQEDYNHTQDNSPYGGCIYGSVNETIDENWTTFCQGWSNWAFGPHYTYSIYEIYNVSSSWKNLTWEYSISMQGSGHHKIYCWDFIINDWYLMIDNTGSGTFNQPISSNCYSNNTNLTIYTQGSQMGDSTPNYYWEGRLNWQTDPTNIKIYINNTLDKSFVSLTPSGTLTTFSTGETLTQLTYSATGAQKVYLRLLKTANVTGAKINIQGTETSTSFTPGGSVIDYWVGDICGQDMKAQSMNITYNWTLYAIGSLIFDDLYPGTCMYPSTYDPSNWINVTIYTQNITNPTGSPLTYIQGNGSNASCYNSETYHYSLYTNISLNGSQLYWFKFSRAFCTGNTIYGYTDTNPTGKTVVSDDGGSTWTPWSSSEIRPIYYYYVYPHSVTVDTGDDGVNEWSYGSKFNTTVNVNLNATSINSYLESCTSDSNGYCLVPIKFVIQSPGKLTISEIEVNYTQAINPINLNGVLLQAFIQNSTSNQVTIPLKISSQQTGKINVTSLRINYNGTDTITVFAHHDGNSTYNKSNSTQIINIVYSGYDISLPKSIAYPIFVPTTNISKNVTPTGQTSSKPIFNITRNAYDQPFIFYLSVENAPVCVNLTMSNTSTKGTTILNTTNQTILTCSVNPGTYCGGNWQWADYNCAPGTMAYWFNYTYYTKCTSCV